MSPLVNPNMTFRDCVVKNSISSLEIDSQKEKKNRKGLHCFSSASSSRKKKKNDQQKQQQQNKRPNVAEFIEGGRIKTKL